MLTYYLIPTSCNQCHGHPLHSWGLAIAPFHSSYMYTVIIFRTIAGHSLRGVQQCLQTVGGEERETAIEQEPAGRFEEQDQVRLEELTKVHESLGSEDDSQRRRLIEMSRRVTLPTRLVQDRTQEGKVDH